MIVKTGSGQDQPVREVKRVRNFGGSPCWQMIFDHLDGHLGRKVKTPDVRRLDQTLDQENAGGARL